MKELSCPGVDSAGFLADSIPGNLGFFPEYFSYSWIGFLVRMEKDFPHGAQRGFNVHISEKQKNNDGKTKISEYSGTFA